MRYRRTNRQSFPRHCQRVLTKVMVAFALLASLLGTRQTCGEEAGYTEYQVKALFLFNFAKYVDWPEDTFANESEPLTIGVIGQNNFGEHLTKAVEGKMIGRRTIAVRKVETDEELRKCQILFISATEKKRLDDILRKTRTLPILTVGETEQFTERGGIVNFVKKDGKVRLEIDLDSARAGRLQLSAKLLRVADVVKGKQ